MMITRIVIVSACRRDDPEFLILIHHMHARTHACMEIDGSAPAFILFSFSFQLDSVKRSRGKSAPIRT